MAALTRLAGVEVGNRGERYEAHRDPVDDVYALRRAQTIGDDAETVEELVTAGIEVSVERERRDLRRPDDVDCEPARDVEAGLASA